MPSLNISALKYPIGFIRVIEFVFIVIAIAAVNSWSVNIQYKCADNTTKTENISTFSLSEATINGCQSNKSLWASNESAGGSASFFYFVNVTALIYVLIILFIYIVIWEFYQLEKRVALADLAITALFFILFFFCSATWWAGANTIGKATEKEHLTVILKEKFNATYISNQTHNGKLVISVLSDWVCVFTFAFNCWFIWKEVVPKQSMDPTQIA